MRFRSWLQLLLTTLVVGMTAVFLVVVVDRLRDVARAEAQARFALLARQVAAPLQAELQHLARAAQADAEMVGALQAQQGRTDPQVLAPLLMGSLRRHPGLASQYVGLANDDFLQVTALRAQPLWTQALEAPAAAWFGVRSLVRGDDGARRESWVFLDEQGRELDRRWGPADYLPVQRDWFRGALATQPVFLSAAYIYASTGLPGLTLAAALPGGQGVFGLDLALDGIDALLAQASASPHAVLAVVDGQGRVLGWRGLGARRGEALTPLATHADPDIRALAGLAQQAPQGGAGLVALAQGEQVFAVEPIRAGGAGGVKGPEAMRLLVAAPLSDFTASVRTATSELLLAAGLILLVLAPLAALGTRRVTRALDKLAANSERLRALDFSQPPQPIASFVVELNALGQAQQVTHDSLRQRTEALDLARRKLAQIVDNGIRMGRERDRQALLRHVLAGARDIGHCQAATLFLPTGRDTLEFALRTDEGPLPAFEVPLRDPATGAPVHHYVSAHVALTAETVVIDDVYAETRYDLSGTKRFSEASGVRVVSLLTVPLHPRDGEVIGVLQLINCLDPETGAIQPFDAETVGFIEALATQSAVIIENQQLLLAQKDLMDSMIKVIAGAIDAKSAYTGGHCARVPALAMMLAEEATAVREGPLAAFGFHTEDEWSEFRIGAWLHDCGKVTTPEYVVDKATKLETIYNRIHEIRTRFEVLLRDAEIAALKAIAAGADAATAWAGFAARSQALRADFAFVAECNLGAEFMAPERVARIRAIAQQTWLRHFDDRLGLSHTEAQRLAGVVPAALPVAEPLLADLPRHIVPRERGLDPQHGFQVRVPEHLYNHGEVYNLSIGRGTLTEEERFKINEHIIQTIVMLEAMPFPKHLRRVPEYAGTHHETLTGSGYPRRLVAEQLSVPARIMAIADIFEALTASDRPYKKAKPLSEAVRILSFFKKDGHIDPVLFDLFLRSGAYLRYAERFLPPEQIDAVDVAAYLG
ncbi:HD domain-containing phosphohydrolase [Pseudorhodoferax sp.]|uniref:HD domain-containing phosphohydrolase n=1 Tax=Pseudorhodoferax sp. TaxID=1993553 RepID=UPI002DD62A64|nr:HD domain-containing phosphohydrolase [Pseudorhodoferax sp.]